MGKGGGQAYLVAGVAGPASAAVVREGAQRYSNLVGRLLGHAVPTVMSALGPVFGPKTSMTGKTRRINQGKLAHLFWELGAKWAAGSTFPLSLSLSTPRSTFGWPPPPSTTHPKHLQSRVVPCSTPLLFPLQSFTPTLPCPPLHSRTPRDTSTFILSSLVSPPSKDRDPLSAASWRRARYARPLLFLLLFLCHTPRKYPRIDHASGRQAKRQHHTLYPHFHPLPSPPPPKAQCTLWHDVSPVFSKSTPPVPHVHAR